LLLSCSLFTYAHQDFWMTNTFGKVKVRIKTGFDYEEINKAWIIGELANKLAKNLEYRDTIFLDFNHNYTEDCLPDYFISFDDGSIKQTWSGAETVYFLKNKALVIREVSRKFNAATTLRLLEYAILNLSSIKSSQKPLTYNKNYCQWLINTIDISLTRQIATKKPSATIIQVLSNRIYKSKKADKTFYNISYYFQNGLYHICYNDYKVKDSVLLITDNIYQFKVISFNEAIVFNTDSTFYFIQGVNNPHASKMWTIQNKNDFYRPYEIAKVGSYTVTFSFWYYSKEAGMQPKERTLLYRSDKEELFQDLDKILDK
jgi:hypothetical protein